MTRRRVWLTLAVGLLSVSTDAAGAYSRDLERARQSVIGRSEVIQTSVGQLEYAVGGI